MSDKLTIVPPSQGATSDWIHQSFRFLTHRGALIYRATTQSIPNNTATTVTWDATNYDTSGIVSSIGNGFIVPNGVTKVKITAQVAWDAAAGGLREVGINKHNTAYVGTSDVIVQGPVGASSIIIQCVTPVLQVTGFDSFSCVVNQTSGASLNLLADTTWFEMQIIG